MTATTQKQTLDHLMVWATIQLERKRTAEGCRTHPPAICYLMILNAVARELFPDDTRLAGAVWGLNIHVLNEKEFYVLQSEMCKIGFTQEQVQDVLAVTKRKGDYEQDHMTHHLLHGRIKQQGKSAIKLALCCYIATARIEVLPGELGGDSALLKKIPGLQERKFKEEFFNPTDQELLPAWQELGRLYKLAGHHRNVKSLNSERKIIFTNTRP